MSRRRKIPSRRPNPQPGKFALARYVATCTAEAERELLAEICAVALERQGWTVKDDDPGQHAVKSRAVA